MTEPTIDGRVREVMYGPGGCREYERTISPANAFSKGICLITAALKAVGRHDEGDELWARYVSLDEKAGEEIPNLAEIFGGTAVMYDHDLARARRWAFLLGMCNLAVVILYATDREWGVAAASFCWLFCCCLWRRVIDAQQRTRDMGRVIEAGLHSRRVIETGEF